MSAISTLLPASLTCALALCLLPACAHHRSPEAETVPSMPAPLGQIYTHALAESSDPVVSKAIHGLPWDEVLSGAASGVALAMLEGEKPTPYRLRWHAVLAAWPYPLVGFFSSRVGFGEVPKDLVADATRRAAAGQDLGIVRARDANGDLWVLLASSRSVELGPLPRDPDVGNNLNLLGADFNLVDPQGTQIHANEGKFQVDQPGVWLLQALGPNRATIATIPLFVGEKPPLIPPIEEDLSGASEESALQLLDDVRAWYKLPSLTRDPALDSVARARMRLLSAGSPLPSPENSLRASGFVDVPVAGAECKATGLAACLDGLWWTPSTHGIFSPNLDSVGISVSSDEKGVTLVLVAAGG